MTKYFWNRAISGDWATTIDWSPAGLPNAATDDGLINLPGSYAVTIAAADPGYTADSVTLDDGLGTLAIGSTLTLGGTSHLLAIQAGQVVLEGYATLQGATVSETGGLLAFGNSYSTLSADSIIGRLALDGQTVDVTGGLTVTALGGGLGTIDLLQSGSNLDVLDSETLNNAAILLGGGGGIDASGTTGQTLTLGSQSSVVQTFGAASFTGQEILNQGVITLSNGNFSNSATTLTNAAGGTISLLNGETFNEYFYNTIVNAGLIQIGQDAVLNIGIDTVTNTGSITVAAGGTLDIASPAAGSLGAISNAGTVDATGTYTLAAFAGMTGNGLLELGGTLNLGGGTLEVQAGTSLSNVLINGLVENGTIEATSGTLSLAGATLDGVTYLGTLRAPGTIEGGLTVETAAGGLPGTIDLTSANAYVLDSETLNNVSILFNNAALIAQATLTLGPQATLTQTGGNSQVYQGILVNEGGLSLAGGTFNDNLSSFTNAATGTISLSNDELFQATYLSYYTLDNAGLIDIGSGATLYANGIFTNTGSIAVTGGMLDVSTASVESVGTISNAGTVAVGGSYGLASLAGVSGSGLLELGGTLDLGGGTLDIQAGTSLSNVALSGLVENGTIEVTSGSLSLAGATLDGVTFLGSLVVPNNNYFLYVEGGLTAETAAGGVPGTIDLTAGGANLDVQDNETLSSVSLLLGNGRLLTPSQFTLGASVVATQTGGAFIFRGFSGTQTLTNDGTLILGGGTAGDEESAFVNAGQISLLAGEDFYAPDGGQSFSNLSTGTITIASGATLDMSNNATLTNAGSIALQAGGTLLIGAATSLTNLGSITGAGTVAFNGTAALGTSTLTLNSTSGISNLLVEANGELLGGTVVENSGSLLLAYGVMLDAATVLGELTVGSYATITGGITVENQAGTAPGTIDLATNSSSLYVTDSETLANVTVLVGNGDQILPANGTTLTLGANAQMLQTRGSVSFGSYNYYYETGTIDNKGLIQLSNGSLTDNDQTLINDGTLSLLNNESFVFGSNQVGTIDVTNTNLLQIGAASTLALSYGLFTNTGTFQVQAGGDLQVYAAANFAQNGTVQVAASGTVELASSVTLSALGSLTGTGTLIVDSGATLDLGGGTLDIGGGDGFNTVVLDGTITDGTLEYDPSGQGGLVRNGGTLSSSVTVTGTNGIGATTTLTGDTNLAGGTLDIAPGTADSNVLLQNGDLRAGTLELGGGVLTFGGGATLDGITLLGALVIPPGNNSINVKDGLTVLNLNGTSPGTIDLSAAYIYANQSSLNFLDSETLSNVSILLGDNGTLTEAGGDTLTLGATTSVTHFTSGRAYLYDTSSGSAFANAGTIAITNGSAFVYTPDFINSGTLTIGTGVLVEFQNTLVNSGTITVAGGGTLDIGDNNSGVDLANTGSISIAADGTLELFGTVTPAILSGITNNGTVIIGGTLDLQGGTLDVKPGSIFDGMLIGGVVTDGTVEFDGGTLGLLPGAALDGITILGPLELQDYASVDGNPVIVRDGLTVGAAGGPTPGTITIDSEARLEVADTETLSNVAITLGHVGLIEGGYGGSASLDADMTLTLASSVALSAIGGGGDIDGGGTLINDGQVLATGTSNLGIGVTQFTNDGTVSLTGTTTLSATQTFDNQGLVSLGPDTTARFTNLTNTGVVMVAAGSTLVLSGTLSPTTFGDIEVAQGGALGVTGTLDLGGGTLDLAPGTEFGDVVLSGDLKNGTVKFDGGTLALNGGTLDGVTTIGSLVLGSSSVNIQDGLTVETAAAGTPGTIVVGTGQLTVVDAETLSNMTISVGTAPNGTGYLNAGTTLTLASSTTLVSAAGSAAYIQGSTLVNDGQILASGEVFYDDATSFTNAGTLTLSGSEEFLVYSSQTFTNTGSIAIGAGTTFNVNNNYAEYFSNTGLISVASGGTLEVGGTLTLAALGTITGPGLIDITGTLNLGGGTLDLTAGGEYGNLRLDGTLANGTVIENGATLTLGSNSTLNGITLEGSLQAGTAFVNLASSLTVENASGGTPGLIDLSKGGVLDIGVSQTLDNVTILGSTKGLTSDIQLQTAPSTLTLGSPGESGEFFMR